MTAPDLAEPDSIAEVCDLLSQRADHAKIIAGGTAVVLMMRAGLIRPGTLVSLNRLRGLDGIEVADHNLRIGALTKLTDVAESQGVRQFAPALARASASVGNIRVRNAATIAGNLAEADYASDLPAVLACLGATCLVRGTHGERQITVDDLITGFYSTALSSDEVITAIDVPFKEGQRSTYLKYVSRSSEDRPCVGVSARARIRDDTVDGLRIVVGAVGPQPVFLDEVCRAAGGRRLDESTIRALADGYADGIEPLDDQRGSAWYRREMIRTFVARALKELAAADA